MTLQQSIIDSLQTRFTPEYLDVINESHSHNVPANSETHFKVVIAAEDFQGKPLVSRHRAVYATVADALNNGVHALALHTYTPQEWAARAAAPSSPDCMGGSKQ